MSDEKGNGNGKGFSKGSLCLKRTKGETILVGNDILIEVAEVCCNAVRLRIMAPKNVPIVRGELISPAVVPITRISIYEPTAV